MQTMTLTETLHYVDKHAGVNAVELLTQMHAEVLEADMDYEAWRAEPAAVLLVGLSFEVAQLIHGGQCPETGLLHGAWVDAIYCAFEAVIDPEPVRTKPPRPQ